MKRAKKIVVFLRIMFVSPESVIVLLGILGYTQYANEVSQIFGLIHLADDPFKYVVVIPSALCIWTFVSGRQVLFPQKDKSNALQRWPDYWRIKSTFHAALVWSVIFSAISLTAWFNDWKHPSSGAWILLVVSIFGAIICSVSVYNAQTVIEELCARFEKNT